MSAENRKAPVGTPRTCGAPVGEGEHGGVFQPTACGCKVTGEGNLQSPIAIKRCALHDAAGDLADAVALLLRAWDELMPNLRRGTVQNYQLVVADAPIAGRAALAKAGKPDPLDKPAKVTP